MQGRRDLNPQPPVLETGTLPIELLPSELALHDRTPKRARENMANSPRRVSLRRHLSPGLTRGCPLGYGERNSYFPPQLLDLKEITMSNAGSPISPRISPRIAAIAESATLAVDAKAKALKAAGRPVIGFGAGEPDFPTPDYIVAAAAAATGVVANHRYTPAAGLPEMREAVVGKTLRDSGYAITADQVLITNGGKQAVYQAFATIVGAGDEVLLPSPYWTPTPSA